MSVSKNKSAYTFAFAFVSAVAFIYLFIGIALVPYWQGMSGAEIQAWWAGPFVRFSYIMVPVHLLSIVTIIYGFIIHRKDEFSFRQLW